jgi:tetratricopeptide (TPR) repeat protein
MPDEGPTLLAVLVGRDERTQDEIVAGFEQCARENGEDATLSLRTLRRWILGDVRTLPRPAQRRVARLYWGRSMDELLAAVPPEGPDAPGADDEQAAADATAGTAEAQPTPAPTAPAPAPTISLPPIGGPARPAAPATPLGQVAPSPAAEHLYPSDPAASSVLGRGPAPTAEPARVAAGLEHVAPASPPDVSEYASLERQVAMSTRRATRFTSFAESRNAGPEAVAQLATEIGALAGDYIREPIVSIMGDLIEAQDTVFGLLEGQQRPTETVDLYTLASVVSALLAKASHDLGRAHDAMTQARTMYVCADNADHTGLQAWARGLQSLIAYWDGRTQEAIRYAEAGSLIATSLRGSVTAWLPALEARAWAQLGNEAEARAAIERARERRETILPDDLDNIGGLLAFPLAKQHYYTAGALVFLDGSGADAEREAQTALDMYRSQQVESSFSDIAGSWSELALARVQRDELAGAREALDPVLELAPARRIGGIITSAERVHEALRAARFADSEEARRLRDEIEAFCQVPASALRR